MLAIDISELLRSQYAQFIKWISELDQGLTDRYGDRYNKVKQQFNRAGDWYEKTKSEAKSSGTIPLDQKQTEISRLLAEAGANTAQKEGVIKMQLKELWRTIKNI
jgi:uncharacterized circularly permuted ATP-grasp superfamily protein